MWNSKWNCTLDSLQIKDIAVFFLFFVFVWWSNNTYFPKSTNFNVVEGCSGSRSSNRIYIINNRILSSSSHRSNRIYSRMWNMKWWTKINLPAESGSLQLKWLFFLMIKLVQQRLATNVSSFFFFFFAMVIIQCIRLATIFFFIFYFCDSCHMAQCWRGQWQSTSFFSLLLKKFCF